MGDLVLTWDSVSGWPTVGDFIIRLDHPNNGTTEYVLCTSVNVGANQTAVTRAQENTSASGGFIVGSTGANGFTKKMYDDSVVRLDTSLSQTLTGPLAIPTALGAAPAATSYGTVPLKFAETLLGSAAASVSFTSIPSTFRHMVPSWAARGDTAATGTGHNARFNNDSAANYDAEGLQVFGSATTVNQFEALAATSMQIGDIAAATAPASYAGQGSARVHHYAGTTFDKGIISCYGYVTANSTGNIQLRYRFGHWRTTGVAINRFDWLALAGNYATGSYFSIYLEP